MLRRAARGDASAVSTTSSNVSDGDALDRWRDRSPIKPKILSLSAGGGLRVKAGALVAFDGPTIVTYSKAAKPQALSFSRPSAASFQWKPCDFALALASPSSRSIARTHS
jgi:hypothetical protein